VPIFAQMTESIATVASPHAFTLASFNPVVTNLLVGALLIICIVMILLVLIQRPQGGGLSGAFGSGGGGGAGQTAFGTKTGDVLTWATIGIFVCFLVFAIVLNFATRPVQASSSTPVASAPAGTSAPATETENPIDLSGSPLDDFDDQASNDASSEAAPEQPAETPDQAPTDPPADLPTDLPTDLPSGDE